MARALLVGLALSLLGGCTVKDRSVYVVTRAGATQALPLIHYACRANHEVDTDRFGQPVSDPAAVDQCLRAHGFGPHQGPPARTWNEGG